MPISTAAPATGRDILKRVRFALFVALAALPTAAPVLAQTPVPGVPTPTAAILLPAITQPTGQMGYYMMQGNRIVSQAYASGPACQKALVILMKSLPGNVAPIVCAHRAP